VGHHEDCIKAMRYERPEYIPVSIGVLPAAWIENREALDEVLRRHPIVWRDTTEGSRDYDAVSGRYVAGEMVDAWGCVWSNIREGCDSIVTKHPVPTRADVHQMKPPAPGAGLPHGFMWLRLADLRGFEEIMVDFAEEPPELQMLIDIVRDYNLGEVRTMIEDRKAGDLIGFGDDLGMQTSLAISAEKWRKYLKPCYAAFYGLCHDKGLDVYMHTDGHILPIIGDLVDCGVNVVNPQIRANGLAGLVRECRGKVCINLDLDRQMFPFCTPAEIDAHVRECVEALGMPEGGLWLSAEVGPGIPLENVEAICQALERYRGYFSR
jgi:hypothetical protein